MYTNSSVDVSDSSTYALYRLILTLLYCAAADYEPTAVDIISVPVMIDTTLQVIYVPNCSNTGHDKQHCGAITCVLILLIQGTTSNMQSAVLPVMYSPAAFNIKLYVIEGLLSEASIVNINTLDIVTCTAFKQRFHSAFFWCTFHLLL
jgi:hypothetical protein